MAPVVRPMTHLFRLTRCASPLKGLASLMAMCFNPFCRYDTAPASSISFNQPLPLSPLGLSPLGSFVMPPRDDRACGQPPTPRDDPRRQSVGRPYSTRFSRRNSPEHLADEFVICSRKGKNVTGVPAFVPNPRPLPPRFTRPSLAQLVITLAICLSDRARAISSPPPHLLPADDRPLETPLRSVPIVACAAAQMNPQPLYGAECRSLP